MTRKQIEDAVSWADTDIDAARDAMANAKAKMDYATSCRAELLPAMLKASIRKPKAKKGLQFMARRGFRPRHYRGVDLAVCYAYWSARFQEGAARSDEVMQDLHGPVS